MLTSCTKGGWLPGLSIFLRPLLHGGCAATKASTAPPSAACGLSRPFCLASLPSACSSSTTPSAANSIDVHRTNLQNNYNSWAKKINHFLCLFFLFDMKMWANRGRHLSLFFYTVSFNIKVLK